MKNAIKRFVKFTSDIDENLNSKLLLGSIRRGLTTMIPVILAGSFALVIAGLPIPAYQAVMTKLFGSAWKDAFTVVNASTFNIMSLVITVSISYSYSTEMIPLKKLGTSPIIASIVSLCSFAALLATQDGFAVSSFGVAGMFIAILASSLSTLLFLRLSAIEKIRIRAFTDGASTLYNNAVSSVLPAAATILAFAAVNVALAQLLHVTDIQVSVAEAAKRLFANIHSPFASGLLFVFLVHILWFFGIHGSNILEPAAQAFFVPKLATNQALINHSLPPTEIFTKTFFDNFVLMGGCGAAICLICAVLLIGRYKNQQKLAKLSLVPVVFNVNELVLFGLPIVLNPIYLIPFLFVPLLLTCLSYAAMKLGLVPYTTAQADWTTPVLLSGYVSTGSIRGSLLQLVNLMVGTLCYIPFVRLADMVAERRNEHNLKKVYEAQKTCELRGLPSGLMARADEVGSFSRLLASDLENDLSLGKLQLYYQPQHGYDGSLTGMEALLRWKHPAYGYLYPPLVIALAEESGMIDRLGYWIFRKACDDLLELRQRCPGIAMSVNVSPMQLENDYFASDIREIVDALGIDPGQVKIEITEQLALTGNETIREQIREIKRQGFKLAMDDFGMGHSSLITLREQEFDTVKLDGGLVREVLFNAGSREIISSIVNLGKTIGYTVIAEYVETSEQMYLLHDLGCDCYQGYYYSRAIPLEDIKEYAQAEPKAAQKREA